MNLDQFNDSDLNGVFRIANLTVAGLSVCIDREVYATNVPAEAYAYGSFFIFRVIASLLIFIIGLVYIGLEAIPSISPPENMNPEGITVGINDEDII
ncbi:hypothetical protein DFJ63DRAFT_337264 [Scheffersomyces coipomensis]|uniref:uncharacterized protein n=1 Tax=Scheffersomyces coipomensis TaxID=1788519 RepID=UPI00315D1ABE